MLRCDIRKMANTIVEKSLDNIKRNNVDIECRKTRKKLFLLSWSRRDSQIEHEFEARNGENHLLLNVNLWKWSNGNTEIH